MSHYNNPKKDKSHMGMNNNAKINQRGFDEIDFNTKRYKNRMDVDRIMLERQMTTHNTSDNDNYVGELTGDEVDTSDRFDKGMPLRSSFTVKKSRFDDNSHLDFNLYNKINNSEKKNVTYYDDSNAGEYAGLDEAMKTITRGVDPYETCISDITNTTCWMHSNMFMVSKEDYIVNGFGLFSGFGVIYMISQGNTELEVKNYFGFQEKRHLNAGLLTIREKLNEHRNQIVMDNYLINDRYIPSSKKTANKLKNLIFNIVINKSCVDEEQHRINNIISTVSGINQLVVKYSLK